MIKATLMQKTITHITLIILMYLVGIIKCHCQKTITLEGILNDVINESFESRFAKNELKIAKHAFKFYVSQKRPNVGISANLPGYSKTSFPVIQPDGTISFQSISQANSSVSVFARQNIALTGGTIFVNSDIQRFDDLSSDFKQYNGIPVRVGIFQPLFALNPWKFQESIQPFLLEEAERTFNIKLENALASATELYFNILVVQQNLEIALTNQKVNENLLKITEERWALGKVSKDEKLQLEIELNNAKLNVSQATTQLDQSIAILNSFIGTNQVEENNKYQIPEIIIPSQIDIPSLLNAYKINRPEIVAYHRALSEAELEIATTKNELGFQANLQASIGLAKGADQLKDVYVNPINEQQFNLSVSIPIVDWGRKKHAVEQLKIRKDNIDASYKQQFLEIENDITQQALYFARLQGDISLLEEIMLKAEERFNISNDRYVLGNIDITNLTLAQREKDQAKRNYINALQTYWVTYYRLRSLSGYDLIKNKNIEY